MSVLLHDFEAPSVAVDRCGAFTADPDEPGICTTCGWLHDEHQDSGELRGFVAA
ncbi:MAG: hypothetical protein ACXVKA_14185 [Acidimicrobiia bacterium]